MIIAAIEGLRTSLKDHGIDSMCEVMEMHVWARLQEKDLQYYLHREITSPVAWDLADDLIEELLVWIH